MPDPWDPPLDNSGGYFVAQYSNGPFTHRQRLHVAAYDSVTEAYTTPSGTEIHVSDTIAAWFQIWKLFFTNAWTIELLSLFHIAAHVKIEIFPAPAVTPVVGANAGPDAAGGAFEEIFSTKTSLGGAARIVFLGGSLDGTVIPRFVTPATPAPAGTLISYIGGVNTRLVGHDGGNMVAFAKETVTLNRRLRRRYQLT